MPKDELIEIFSESKPKLNFPEQKKKEIREKLNELRDKFSKPKIKEIRGSLYKIENKKKSFYTKNKRDWNHDDIKYKGIRDVRNLFNLTIDEDY